MTVLTTIPNGASHKDIRDTLNSALARILALETTTPAPTPTVALSAAQARAEGNTGATAYSYTVTRSATAGAVSVPWSFAPGSTSPSDFVGGVAPAGGTVALADGVASGTITIMVQGDATVEPDESFTVSIAAPSGYALGTASSATGAILNDDAAAPTPTGLVLNAPFTLADNSYGQQLGSIDVSQWTWMGMGCRGLPTLGLVQARGGDRLSHLLDRLAPVKACAANGATLVMNVENDLADAAVTANAAGGDVLLARLDQIAVGVRAGGGKLAVTRQAATNAAIGMKASAVARYHAGLATRAGADLILVDDAAVFDPQDLTQSSDKTHPDKSKSARALGLARGAALASLYAGAGIFDGGGQLPGNFNAGWNMGPLGVLTNNSGASATRAAGFLRSRPDVPCQVLSLSGTVTADPTAAAAIGDVQLRFATPHPANTNTFGKAPVCIAFIEITDSAGGDPIGLATMQLQCGQSTGFGKRYTAAHGPWGDGKKYVGPIGIARATQINAQSLPMNTDVIIRALMQAGVDIELRIAWLNVIYVDDVASGAAANGSAIFTAGRPALFALPTTTPAAGPLAVGGTLGLGGLPTILGGGLTRIYEVIRGGVEVVGTVSGPTATTAATSYTVQPADSGSTLALRATGSNGFGGGSSASATSAALAVG